MAANENAPTQPTFELGISGIIHNVFQGDKTTKHKFEKLFPREGAGVTLHGKFHENNIFFFETFPNSCIYLACKQFFKVFIWVYVFHKIF